MVREFSESELLRLAQDLAEAEEAGYCLRKAYVDVCGGYHRWEILRDIYDWVYVKLLGV